MDSSKQVAASDPPDKEEGYRFVLPRRSASFGSRCVVEMTPSGLRVREELGPLHWTWHHTWTPATIFQVMDRLARASERPILGIRAREGTQDAWFAPGYPEAKLGELVQHLRAAQAEWGPGQNLVSSLGSSPSRAKKGAPIQVHRTREGLRVDVPPLGLFGGSQGLWALGLAFCGFTLLMGGFLLFGSVTPGGNPVTLVLGLVFFLAIGVLMTVTGWNMATRRAIITLDEDGLQITRTSILGVQTKNFPRFSITNVARGPSGMVVNGKPINELQFYVRGRKALGMMSQRSDADIEQVAAALMEELSGGS